MVGRFDVEPVESLEASHIEPQVRFHAEQGCSFGETLEGFDLFGDVLESLVSGLRSRPSSSPLHFGRWHRSSNQPRRLK